MWVLAAGVALATPGGRGPAAADAPAGDLLEVERQTTDRVRRHRHELGRSALISNGALIEIARAHSRDMARRGKLDHASFDTRKQAVMRATPYAGFGENVFRSTRAPDEVPGAALQSWLDSPPHRTTLEGAFTLTGVGAARGDDGRIYLTQLFVREQGPEFAPQ